MEKFLFLKHLLFCCCVGYANTNIYVASNYSINVFSIDLDFSFLEMNPFTLVNGEPYPLDMRGELDDTAAFKNFKK